MYVLDIILLYICIMDDLARTFHFAARAVVSII